MNPTTAVSRTVRVAGWDPLLRLGMSVGAALLVGGSAWTVAAQAQTDNFDTGTDLGWQKSTNQPATFTFPADVFGGHAYRLQGTPADSGSDTNARAFSVLTNRVYTNFWAAVDVVAWNTNQDCDQVIGLIARAERVESGAPNGITLNVRLHNKRSYSGPGETGPLGARDQMSLWSMVGSYQGSPIPSLGGPAGVTQPGFQWVPGHGYRLVLSSTNNPAIGRDMFTGSIYDLNDLTRPLLTMTGDTAYNSNDQLIPASGYIGVFAYHLNNDGPDVTVDATFDNFYADDAPPASVAPPAIPHGLMGVPQVVNRTPASFVNLHPAASGIAFNAATLTATNGINTNAIKLFLNGVDVSGDLLVAGPGTNASVSYNKLAADLVYDARIELQDVLGRRTTNEWTFDTFTDAYLDSPAVKVIEAEDYNFQDGQFIDDPLPSGYTTNGTAVNVGATGYVEQVGTNARLGGSDFLDYDSGPHAPENQFRSNDAVGTQQGNFGDVLESDVNSAGNVLFVQTYDTQRLKYRNADPALEEYMVRRTEGGEWLNYTRLFDGRKYYNAFLRVAGGLAQPVRFDQIAAGPVTNSLGWFNVPSTFYINNYRYVPLVTTNGSLAVVNLDGTNTVRLTMDSPPSEGTKWGLSLNYLVLVPALLLESAAQVEGPYAIEPAARVDAASRSITVPQSGSLRFYRARWDRAITFTSISVNGANVVLTYR